ncbi:MAG: NAD(P)H-hydrate dehydratase [Anaerolineaceae bacterium]|nr:NAD(P)H-hydrate dehydratase [Anaerolineaceae bacterium]
MKILSVSQMTALEKKANEEGMTYEQMMLNAGSALAEVVHERFGDIKPRRVLGLIGSGNNGGDTLIALHALLGRGWEATAYLIKQRDKNDPLVLSILEQNGSVISGKEDTDFRDLRRAVKSNSLILDGILGTGAKLPLRQDIAVPLKEISRINDLPPIIAVDCPSGTDSDSGDAAEETLVADLTVCMAAVKEGLLKFPAFKYTGELTTVDIGLPEHLKSHTGIHYFAADEEMVKKILPERPLNAHKGTFGTCMIVGGSANYCGAVLLAAKSAYRVGSGLVRAAIPGSIYEAIAGHLPESTWILLPQTLGVINRSASKIIQQNLDRVKAVLIGPGMGHEKETLDFLENLLKFNEGEHERPEMGFSAYIKTYAKEKRTELPTLVFDADALRLLARIKNWEKELNKTAVLTPHPGEMSALTGLTIEEIQKDRRSAAMDFAQKWGHVLILKGAITVVAAPDGKCTFIPIATPALATAGTGDVLAGMVTGLIAQGVDPYDAAVAGAWLHAKAGLRAAVKIGQTYSVIASDVVDQIQNVIRK